VKKACLWRIKFDFCSKQHFFGLIVLAVEPVGIGELIIDDFFGPEKQLDFLFCGLGAVGAVNEVVSF
jgi:hypothetical protein